MKKVCCIVLGGGQGTRLYPLTRDRSKPAVPIGGKYRLIDISLSNSINSGVERMFILTQFNSVSLNRHISSTYHFDYFSNREVNLLAAEQTIENTNWFQGTADAVRRHMPHYHLQEDDDVLVLSGDHLYRMDFSHLVKFHREKDADVTVSTLLVPGRIAHQFGILKFTKAQKITDFAEKPSGAEQLKHFCPSKDLLESEKSERYFASMGIYLFKASVLKDLLIGDETDFGKEIIPKAIQTHKAYGYIFKDYWRDIGTIRSFYEANLELTSKNPRFSFVSDEGPIYTQPHFLKPAKIENSKLKNTLISDGSVILNAEIENSVIGLRSVIGKKVQLRRSIMMGVDEDYSLGGKRPSVEPSIGDGCIIENAILDKNVKIGKNVKILNKKGVQDSDGEHYCIRDGIVIISKNTVIPDGTII